MKNRKILLLCGGGGTEHEVSLVSAGHIYKTLQDLHAEVVQVEIKKDLSWMTLQGEKCTFNLSGILTFENGKSFKPDFAIPCVHGYPGETGELAALFELTKTPYLGPDSESSILSFNKVSTKLWLTALGIPNTPFIFLNSPSDLHHAKEAFKSWGGTVFVKASKQGSSVGCYRVTTQSELEHAIKDAFTYSPTVLIEKLIVGRELEISVYEIEGEVIASKPGEIICPDHFYSYEEKYSGESKTSTVLEAKGLSALKIEEMQKMAIKAFKGLGLRHLSRVDFFYTSDAIYINEINTFPGMTPISMFPKMMENNGHLFKDYLSNIIIREMEKYGRL